MAPRCFRWRSAGAAAAGGQAVKQPPPPRTRGDRAVRGEERRAACPAPRGNASGDIIEATTEPLDLARYLDAVRGIRRRAGPELATLISTSLKHGDKQPLGESCARRPRGGRPAAHLQAIRKRWNCRRMALVLRLGAASSECHSSWRARRTSGARRSAAEHAAIEIKDKLIASIAPQCSASSRWRRRRSRCGGGGGCRRRGRPPKNDDGG